MLFTSKNLYYNLFYLFVLIIVFGLSISLFQYELFTGFLWVLEFTIIFISILLLFYLNIEGNVQRIDLFESKLSYLVIILVVIFTIPSLLFSTSAPIIFFPLNDIWDDYYEALKNLNVNDFTPIFLSYYTINSLEFLLVGFLLLVGSVVCVSLNKASKIKRVKGVNSELKSFELFSDLIDFVFMRKQNLFDQTSMPSASRFYKKK